MGVGRMLQPIEAARRNSRAMSRAGTNLHRVRGAVPLGDLPSNRDLRLA